MAKQSKHRNSDNFVLQVKDLEHVSPASQTAPDETPDLKTLLQKRSNGHLVPVLDGKYTDHEIPDLELMDTLDILMYREELAEQMELTRDKFHQLTKEAEKREFDEELEKRFKTALEAKLKPDSPLDGEQS